MTKFESFPTPSSPEPTEHSLLESAKRLFESPPQWLKMLAIATLAYAALESAGTLPRKHRESRKPGSVIACEIGTEEPVTLEIVGARQFAGTWNLEKVAVGDSGVRRLLEQSVEDEYRTPIQDQARFSRFMESQLARPDLRERCGISDEQHADNPNPDQAILLAREIVRDNLEYDADVFRYVQDADILEERGEDAKPALSATWDAIRTRKQEINAFAPEEIYEQDREIVCTHAAGLFRQNFEWLKVHKGLNLKNVYVGSQDGNGYGSRDERARNHIWSKIAHVYDENGDGRADAIELTYEDATPFTKRAKEKHLESGASSDTLAVARAVQELRSLADLRRGGLLTEQEYEDIVRDFDRLNQEWEKKQGVSGGIGETRELYRRELERGAQTDAERERLSSIGV